MLDDLFNAIILAMTGAIGAAAAASAFDADAASTLPSALVAQTHAVSLPIVVVIGRRASRERDLALTSDE